MASVSSVSSASTVIRWIIFVPVAIAASVAVRFAVGLAFRVILQGTSVASILADIFVGAVAFVWAGAIIAPSRRSGTAITLASVYTFLFLVVELFREPREVEPVSHGVILLAAIAGTLAGLFLALRQIKSEAKRDTIRAAIPGA